MTKEDKVKTPKSKKTKHAVKEGKEEKEGKKSKELKELKEVKTETEVEAVPYEIRMKAVTTISKPMADEKKVQTALLWS